MPLSASVYVQAIEDLRRERRTRYLEAGRRLFPATQDSGHHARTAVAMHYSDHPERFFIGRIGDQVIPDAYEAQRAVRQVGAAMADMGERNDALNGSVNVVNYAMRGSRAVLADISGYFIDVDEGFGGEARSLRSCWAVGPRVDPFMEADESLLAIDQLYPAAFDVIVARIEQLAGFGKLVDIAGHGVMHQVGGGATALAGDLIELGLQSGFKLHFHGVSFRDFSFLD